MKLNVKDHLASYLVRSVTNLSALLCSLPIWQIVICVKTKIITASLDDGRRFTMYVEHNFADGEQVNIGEANPQDLQILCSRQGFDDVEATCTEHASTNSSHQDTGAQHQEHCLHQTTPLMQLKRQYQTGLNDRIVLFCAGQPGRQMMSVSADLIDVGICTHNQRALATTLQGHMLHGGCCICQNLFAH